jgi:hypothetical protein
LQELNINSSAPEYKDSLKSIVLQLKQPIQVTHPVRSLRIKYQKTQKLKSQPADETITLTVTFLVQEHATIVKSSTEALALRPIPFEHLSQMYKLFIHHYQSRTIHPLTMIGITMDSRLKLKSQKLLNKSEQGFVLLVSSSLDEYTLDSLRRSLGLSKQCTYEDIIKIHKTIACQVAPSAKHFSFLAYPNKLISGNLCRYVIISGIQMSFSIQDFLQHHQLHQHYGHCILLAYKVLVQEECKLNLVVDSLSDYVLDSIRAALKSQVTISDMTIQTSTSLVTSSKNTLLVPHEKVVVFTRPIERYAAMSKPATVTAITTQSTDKKKMTLRDFYKVQPSSISNQK